MPKIIKLGAQGVISGSIAIAGLDNANPFVRVAEVKNFSSGRLYIATQQSGDAPSLIIDFTHFKLNHLVLISFSF